MTSIKDSNQTSIADHTIDLQIREKNLLTLSPEQTDTHLKMLIDMLHITRRLIYRKLPKDGGENVQFLNYLYRLSRTLEAMILRNRLEAEKPNKDIRFMCTINPGDSGFPVFIRDIRFLRSDQKASKQELARLPSNEKLVDDALFLLFRGHFPRDVILQKSARDYYEMLSALVLPELLKIYEEKALIVKEEKVCYCKKSFERFDDHSNIPRFYTLHLKIPLKTYTRNEWRAGIRQAITDGLSTVTNLELMYLAKKVESVEGIQVEYVERFDIGPFYNKHTQNKGTMASLITADDDCLFMFRRYSVFRTSQKRRSGIANWFRGIMSGDEHTGEFSPAIASPRYMLMPHRLIQKIHNLNLPIRNAKMYGITSTGEINE